MSAPLPRFLLAAIFATAITGCLGDLFEPSPGDFYGSEDGIIMVITPSGADLEWDCAVGEITESFATAEKTIRLERSRLATQAQSSSCRA
jgi:hypothetical protein